MRSARREALLRGTSYGRVWSTRTCVAPAASACATGIGGMGAPIPVAEAVAAGATHVLALQTRPYGVPRKSASRLADRMIERHLRGLNPALVTLYRARVAAYEDLVQDIARRTRDPEAGPPHVLGIRPPAGTPCVSQIERRPAVLDAAAKDAERIVEADLGAYAPRPAVPR